MSTIPEVPEIDLATTLYAVVRHMKDYSLPTPRSLDTYLDRDSVSVFVLSGHVDAWLDSMIVDHETITACSTELPAMADHERALFRGRIITAAHGAVAFELRTVRRATTTLRSVSA